MKYSYRLFLLLFFAFSINILAQPPPIIDREIFFGDPEISGAQISPDGKYITFLKPFNNVRNIWIKGANQEFDEAHPLTADTSRPIRGYFWSQDGKYVLYVQDKGGDENYRVYAVDPAAEGNPVPPARDLTPLENVRATIIAVPKNTPNEIIVGLNDRDPQLHDVYKVNLTTGERKLIRQNNENIAGWVTDLKGNLRLGAKLNSTGGTDILKIDGEKLVPIYTVNNEETAAPVRFSPDGSSFYMITNKGDKLDKTELVLFNLKTGKAKLVEKDPLNEVDFGYALFSDKSNELLATVYVGDRKRVYPKQKQFAKDYEILKKEIPGGDLSLMSVTADENIWLVSDSRDVDPGSVYIFNRTTGKAKLLYKSRPNLPSEQLAYMKPVKYESRDGLTIHSYLTLPKGIPNKDLPTVMLIHGGPWSRVKWGYNGVAQFLSNRGYAVLQPNFRGSTGYGKKFLNAGNKQWGRGAMQHDITDGVKWLIKEGIADPKRVAIAGGSYGGYATLAGLAFTPDLYAAGFDIVGPSNIITLLNTIPPYWAPIKKIFDVRVGDVNNPEDKKMLEEDSPLNYAKDIKAPLFVVQGANDPRVKKAESDQIVVALRDLGRQVEYMVAPDEGHGFAGELNRLAMFTAMEKFFVKYLDGRVQKDVRKEIQKKLDDIMVDIKTVTLPKPASPIEKGVELKSFDGSKIKAGSAEYTMDVEARGQKISMGLKRSISKAESNGKEIWRVVDEIQGTMGGADTLDLDMNTLLPIERSIKQGPAVIHLTFKPEAVEGKVKMGPQEMPINVKLDAPVLSDGAGVELALRTLPLAKGYSAAFNQLDLMGAKIKPMSVKVIDSEKVKIGSSEYDTYKVEVKPLSDDGAVLTLWLTKDTKQMVKSETKLGAQMGGGTVILELKK